MSKKKPTLDDILNDDDFGLLDSKPKTSNVKPEEDRLIDSFEEINVFIDKNGREPDSSSMAEYGLLAKLRNFKRILLPQIPVYQSDTCFFLINVATNI